MTQGEKLTLSLVLAAGMSFFVFGFFAWLLLTPASVTSSVQGLAVTMGPCQGGISDGEFLVADLTNVCIDGQTSSATLAGATLTDDTALVGSSSNVSTEEALCDASTGALYWTTSTNEFTCSNNITGNAATATALAANGANCAAGNYPLGVDASGAVESCTAVGTGSTIAIALDSVTIDDAVSGIDWASPFLVSTTGTTGSIDLDTSGPWAGTAGALAANGTNCSANQFNKGVDASGNAESCAALVDADVPDTITIDLAATATALAANGTNCSANQFPKGVDASGNSESCASVDLGTDDATGTLDVSDHLNLTAGRSLTLTGDEVAADAELYERACSITIVSASTTLDQNLVCGPPNALAFTVTRLFCITESGTASYTVDERTRANIFGSGTAVEAPENLNCNTSGVTVSAGIDNASIAAGSVLAISFPTISVDGDNISFIVDGTFDD